GRRTPPASTRSVTELARRRSSTLAAAPMRHQACGTSATVASSASPWRASTKTGRPAARRFSRRRRGSAPLPAIIPSGPALAAIRAFWLADRARRVGPDKGEDIVDRGDAAEALGHFCDPVVESAVGREQKLIGAAQRLDVLATKAAALHADDVEPTEAGAIAHDLAIGNDVALDTGHTANHRMLPDPHELVHRREHDLLADDAVRTDRDILGQCRPRRDDRGGVDLRHRLPNRRGSWRRRSPRPSIGRPPRRGPRTSRHCRGCAAW